MSGGRVKHGGVWESATARMMLAEGIATGRDAAAIAHDVSLATGADVSTRSVAVKARGMRLVSRRSAGLPPAWSDERRRMLLAYADLGFDAATIADRLTAEFGVSFDRAMVRQALRALRPSRVEEPRVEYFEQAEGRTPRRVVAAPLSDADDQIQRFLIDSAIERESRGPRDDDPRSGAADRGVNIRGGSLPRSQPLPTAPSERGPLAIFDPTPAPKPGRPVSLLQLNSRRCRWPLFTGSVPAADEPAYCGRATTSGSYCAVHGGAAFRKREGGK